MANMQEAIAILFICWMDGKKKKTHKGDTTTQKKTDSHLNNK